MAFSMWSWVVPLIRTALEKITVETIVDWGTCFATASESRDPTAIHWMMEVLMEEPIRLVFSSFSFVSLSLSLNFSLFHSFLIIYYFLNVAYSCI